MTSAEPASSQDRIEVETACGGKMVLADDTPRASHQGETVYFCLMECKVKFDADPLNSCLDADCANH